MGDVRLAIIEYRTDAKMEQPKMDFQIKPKPKRIQTIQSHLCLCKLVNNFDQQLYPICPPQIYSRKVQMHKSVVSKAQLNSIYGYACASGTKGLPLKGHNFLTTVESKMLFLSFMQTLRLRCTYFPFLQHIFQDTYLYRFDDAKYIHYNYSLSAHCRQPVLSK